MSQSNLLKQLIVRKPCRLFHHPLRSQLIQTLTAMNPTKVARDKLLRFTDLPNIGPAAAHDFEVLGFASPSDLVGADPLKLYLDLCTATGSRQDPCVLDVFISVTDFLAGGTPQPWWHFTELRKRQYGNLHSTTSPVSKQRSGSLVSLV